MKKFSIIILSLILLLSLTACSNNLFDKALNQMNSAQEEIHNKSDIEEDQINPHDDLINDAIKELKSTWKDIYDNHEETNRYFEIKNTRVVEIKENGIEEFKNVDYIIEFLLYTNYFGSAPYYSSLGTTDSVTVYDNGDMDVFTHNLLWSYSTQNYTYDYSDIVDTVTDYNDKYNCIEYLK